MNIDELIATTTSPCSSVSNQNRFRTLNSLGHMRQCIQIAHQVNCVCTFLVILFFRSSLGDCRRTLLLIVVKTFATKMSRNFIEISISALCTVEFAAKMLQDALDNKETFFKILQPIENSVVTSFGRKVFTKNFLVETFIPKLFLGNPKFRNSEVSEVSL